MGKTFTFGELTDSYNEEDNRKPTPRLKERQSKIKRGSRRHIQTDEDDHYDCDD